MHPWLLNGPPISTYGACIVTGLVLAWLLARRLAKTAALDASLVDLLIPALAAAGILGAYAFGRWTDAVTDEASHGTVLFGSLVVATLAGVGYALIARIPLGVLGDVCAAPVALAIACGRVGCFFAGCCYGKVSPVAFPPLGVRFPRNSFAFLDQLRRGLLSPNAAASLPVYPVQLYEAVLCAALAVLLASHFTRRTVSGERFLWLGIGYGGIRFALEFLRADNPPVVGGFTFSQVICVTVVVLAAGTFWLRRRCADSLRLRLSMPLTASAKERRTGMTGPTHPMQLE